MMTLDRAWEGLVTLTLQSVLLCLIAGAGLLLLRKSAAAGRHLLLVLAMSALLAIPFLSLFLPHRQLLWRLQASTLQSPTVPRPTAPRREPGRAIASGPGSLPSRSASAAPTAGGGPTLRSPAPPPGSSIAELPAIQADLTSSEENRMACLLLWQTTIGRQILVGVWLLGVAIALLRVLAGLIGARRVTSRETLSDPALSLLVTQLQQELGLRRPIHVRQTVAESALPVPLTWGLHRPLLLLPPTFLEWPPERRRMVLLHELAHMQRADWLVQMLVQITRALYWFHPLVWWTTTRLQAESERACDDTVLLTGVTPAAYAETLLEVIRTMNRSKKSPLSMLGMAHPPIEARLRAILATRPRQRPSRSVTMLAAVGAAACALILASFQVGARPVMAPRRSAPLAGQAGESPTQIGAQQRETAEANRRLAIARADQDRQNAQALKKRAVDETAQLRQKLDALEQLLVRNQQENTELRQQLNALMAQNQKGADVSIIRQQLKAMMEQNQKSAAISRMQAAQAREKDKAAQALAMLAQQEAMLRDLQAHQETLKARTQQAEAQYRSGMTTQQDALRSKADEDANRARIETILQNINELKSGHRRSGEEQNSKELRRKLADLSTAELLTQLWLAQEEVAHVKARYQAGVASKSELLEAEAKANRIKIEIDKNQLLHSQRP